MRIIHMVVYGFTLTIIVVALFINAIYGTHACPCTTPILAIGRPNPLEDVSLRATALRIA